MVNEEFWNYKKVLITGASGIVGTWLTKRLVNEGASVTALIRDRVSRSGLFSTAGLLDKINVVNGQLEDFDLIERTFNEYEIDTVFHLGAQTIVTTANRSPRSTFEANIKGTWNVLEAIRVSPLIERAIIASTDKAYGEHENLPYTEDFALKPTHPYDASKAAADLLSRTYAHTYALPITITRCGNIYGGGDLNFDRLIPGTIWSILKKERPMIRSDGTFKRDYLYVEDIVDGYMKAGEKVSRKNIRGEVFNFGMNTPLTVMDVVDAIKKEMKSNIGVDIQNKARFEIKHQYLSSEKAKEILGWKPKHDINQGLEKTIPWYKDLFKKINGRIE